MDDTAPESTVINDPEEPGSSPEPGLESPLFPPINEPEMFGGMLNGILGNYFEYEHGDGNTLNVADILLLIRQSINDHTEAVKDLTSTLKDRLPSSSAPARTTPTPVKKKVAGATGKN